MNPHLGMDMEGRVGQEKQQRDGGEYIVTNGSTTQYVPILHPPPPNNFILPQDLSIHERRIILGTVPQYCTTWFSTRERLFL